MHFIMMVIYKDLAKNTPFFADSEKFYQSGTGE